MIQDFQTSNRQTTIASIGLLAQANTVCCGNRLPVSLAARQLELQCRFCSRICLCHSSEPRRRASPAIAIQSKNCTASAAVTMDSGHWTVNVSYATATGLYSLEKSLKPCLDRSSCPWRVTTHCQQMEPLLALCLFPGLSHSSLSLHVLCTTCTLPIGCKAELCNFRQRYHPPSLLPLLLYL